MARRGWLLRLALGLAVPLALVALVAGRTLAEEAAQEEAKKATVTGVVAVEKNDEDAVTGVKVGEQVLVLDEKAKELAGKLAGKKAEVTGTLDEDGNLKVAGYKEVVEKKEAVE